MADINQTTETVLKVNGQQATETLQSLRKRAEELRESIVKAMTDGDTKGAKQMQKSLRDVTKEIRTIQSSAANVEQTMKNLDKAAPNDLRKTLQILERQLQSIERGSSAWTAQVERIKQVKAQIKTVNEELAVHETFMQRMNRTFNNWGQSIMAAAASVTGLVMAGKKAVQIYAEMDQEMANVRKYTGMTAEEVEHMNEEFKKIDTRTSRDNLNKLAQEAGRLGKTSEEDVLGFVKAADKINVALDELGEGATLTLSKLTNIFGDEAIYGTEQSLLKVGSVINELSQNSTAAAPYLAEFAQRMAGVGAQAGMTIPQIMGFGAVLDSQGQAVEMSASALSKLIMNLFKNADKICAATGLNVQKFKETAVKDTNEALIMLLERLHEMGNMDALAPLFKEMGENGVRSSQVLAALAGNIDMVKQQQEAANVAFEEGISIDKEFNVQNNTVQAGLEKARKGFQEMAVTLGKELMPLVSHLISGTSATMRALLKTIQFIKEYRTEIISASAALATYYAIVKAQDAWNAFKKGLDTAKDAVKAFNAALKADPWAAVAAAIVAVTTAVVGYIKRVNEATLAERTEADARKKISEQYSEQRAKIDMLNAAVHDETMSLKNRRDALKQLQELVPDYHASLTDEGKLINDNKEAIDNYLESIQREIEMQVYREKLEELYRKRMQAEENVANRQTDYEKANAALEKNGNKVQIRTSMGAAGPTGGYENSYVVAAKQTKENFDAAKKQLSDIDAAISKIGSKIKDTPNLFGNTPTNPTTKTSTGTPSGSSDTPAKDRFKEEEDWLKREQALNEIAYAQGKASYEEYTHGKLELEEQFQAKRLAKCEKGTTEYLEVMAAHEKAVAALDKSCTTSTIEEENERWSGVKAILDQRYADGEMSARAYQNATELAELEHLQNLVNIYEKGSKERLKAQENYNKRSRQIQQKHIEEDRRMQEQLKKQYFSSNGAPDQADYALKKDSLKAVRKELLQLAKTEEDKYAIEESYQEARYELAREYNDRITMETIDAGRAGCDAIIDYLNSDGGKALTQSFSTIVNGMGQIFSGLTDLIEAETSIQTAQIERRYDAEIAAAGDNEEAVAELEAQKQADIAAVKNEASQKEYEMQVIQTIAQTAIAAVNAYSSAAAIPVAGWILGPVAAAMAIAAGGIQLAALKKQKEAAASQGYAKGRKGGNAELALIGEQGPEMMYIPQGASIIPNNKLQSPTEWEQYGVPIISALDEVQRTNTVGSLSRQDVSRSISAPQVIAETTAGGQLQAGMAAQAATNAKTAEVLDKLYHRIDEPIAAVTTVSGDKGIYNAQRKYDKLIKNKS